VPAVLKCIGIRGRELAAECGAPALAAGVMYAAVVAARTALDGLPQIALSAAGAAAYFLVIAFVSRRHLATARSFLRALLARDAPRTA
jgi:hypothetical protein